MTGSSRVLTRRKKIEKNKQFSFDSHHHHHHHHSHNFDAANHKNPSEISSPLWLGYKSEFFC